MKENSSKFVGEFIDFIKKFGVIGLALGTIIGQATNSIVTSLVSNLLTPLLGLIPNMKRLTDLSIQLNYTNPDGSIALLEYGKFVNDFINFLVLMLVVYFAIKIIINRLLTEDELKNIKVQ
jgi:large conductance mechanosensitive channel